MGILKKFSIPSILFLLVVIIILITVWLWQSNFRDLEVQPREEEDVINTLPLDKLLERLKNKL